MVQLTGRATLATAIVTAASLTTSIEIPLVTYDGMDGSVMLKEFEALVDPVMGGQSTGTWTMNETGLFGRLDAEVKDVPSLDAPGFATAGAVGSYPDASGAFGDEGGILLTVKSPTYAYTGYRVSFAAGASSPSYSCAGGGSLPFSRGCFKADFSVPVAGAEDFVDVLVAYSDFSDKWDSATGDQTTTCAEDSDVCPTAELLGSIQYVEVWAEGVDGIIQLDVSKISAVSSVSVPSPNVESVNEAEPFDDLDISRYAGRWYQIFASINVKDTFQLGGNCVTADYGATNKSDVISVVNTVRPFLGDVVVAGYGVQDPDTQGSFDVVLGPFADPADPQDFDESNYWIIGLGPVNDNGLYDWATVSDPTLRTLYVLARDVDTFREEYQDDVLATLAEQGFTGIHKPVETNQDNCEY